MSMNLKSNLNQQKGVSLVEMMVGIIVGLLVVAAAGAMYVSTSRTGTYALRSAKLNTEVRAVADLMSDEIRRATASQVGGANNPFSIPGSTDIAVYDFNGATDNCIVFSIDRNWTGVVGNQYFGFRINGGAIQMRDQGAGDASNCANGSWEAFTDPNNVTIDRFQGVAANPYFAIEYQCMNSVTNIVNGGQCVAGNGTFDAALSLVEPMIETRIVTIALRGTQVNDTDLIFDSRHATLVRNHRIVTKP